MAIERTAGSTTWHERQLQGVTERAQARHFEVVWLLNSRLVPRSKHTLDGEVKGKICHLTAVKKGTSNGNVGESATNPHKKQSQCGPHNSIESATSFSLTNRAGTSKSNFMGLCQAQGLDPGQVPLAA